MPNYEGRTVPAEALADALEELKGLQSGRIHPESQSADEAVNAAETALRAAQPAPEVRPSADVAAVLSELRDAMVGRANHADCTNSEGDVWDEALALVEAAQQATTGARAAGGESAPDPLTYPGVLLSRLSIAQHALRRISQEAGESNEARSLLEIMEIADGALAVVAMSAAPPAPSAPGVAELLAECARRQEFAPDTGISCDEIVRLLAPGGTDGRRRRERIVKHEPKYVEAPEEYRRNPETDGPSIFLAGGITACEDWQAAVRNLLYGCPVTLLNPRRADFDVRNGDSATQQVEWEYRHLHAADVTMFWFPRCDPRETVQPIALFELGATIAEHQANPFGRRFVVGVDDDYPRRLDIDLQLMNALPYQPVHRYLVDTVEAAVRLAATPTLLAPSGADGGGT